MPRTIPAATDSTARRAYGPGDCCECGGGGTAQCDECRGAGGYCGAAGESGVEGAAEGLAGAAEAKVPGGLGGLLVFFAGWMVAGFAMAGCCRPGAWMKQGGGMALAAVPANTTRILGIVGLDQVFTIHLDAATATA
ncbi:hypothetical protein [Streptomyces aureus]|uniref:Uncharacterized protein n=1 Tax=Streptomyces aureus TaxID=193461 RepID=A0ABV4SZ30_9ACTN